jgi:hypothetical protein
LRAEGIYARRRSSQSYTLLVNLIEKFCDYVHNNLNKSHKYRNLN